MNNNKIIIAGLILSEIVTEIVKLHQKLLLHMCTYICMFCCGIWLIAYGEVNTSKDKYSAGSRIQTQTIACSQARAGALDHSTTHLIST